MEHVRVAADVDATRRVRARGPARRRGDDDTGHLPVGRVDEIRARWADSRYLREQQYASPDNLDARIALHRQFSTNPYGWPRWMFDQIDAADEARVLDVGCGPALLWVDNSERIPPGWSLTLVDISPGMIAAARDRLGDDDRFVLQVADAQELPFGEREFDVVIANHMLYHVPDRVRALREFRRVVRTGGNVYVSTVGVAHMRELHELVQGRSEAPLSFLLEGGEDELRAVFDDVELRLYQDSLEATASGPLLDVVRSGVAGDLVHADELAAISARIERTIAEEGVFRITKSSGVFVCR